MDKNNRRRKINEQHENARDILEMIRARQEQEKEECHVSEKSRLREFLTNLKDEGTIEEDYTKTPIYRLGYEDGFNAGHEKGYSEAYYELFKVLKAVETLIQPHIEKDY